MKVILVARKALAAYLISSAVRRAVMREVYRPLYLHETPILFTGRETSELIKYAANAFLATKITFINEIADLAEKVGACLLYTSPSPRDCS